MEKADRMKSKTFRIGPKSELWLDIATTVLLSVAAVSSSWAGYQATRWSGVQAKHYNKASGMRIESTRASTVAGQFKSVDVLLFSQWLDAFGTGNRQLADFYRKRFRQEFVPAFDAWIAMRPGTNPDAPSTPFTLPEYRVALEERSEELGAEAEREFQVGQAANQQGDDYVLTSVILAVVLFFSGIAQHIGSLRPRIALLSLAAFMCLAGLIQLAVYPIE